jgi:hypothetical protein
MGTRSPFWVAASLMASDPPASPDALPEQLGEHVDLVREEQLRPSSASRATGVPKNPTRPRRVRELQRRTPSSRVHALLGDLAYARSLSRYGRSRFAIA